MAPTRLLLEGTDIESLLAQVREQYGSTARIISADKVRSGGIGGFFSKEKYEISVEIDPDASDEHGAATVSRGLHGVDQPAAEGWPALPTPAHERAAAAIDSVQALLDLADERETRLTQLPEAPPWAAATPANTQPAAHAFPAAHASPGAHAFPAAHATPGAHAFPAPSNPAAEAGLGAAMSARHAARHELTSGETSPPFTAAAPFAATAPADEPVMPSTATNDFAEILAGLRNDLGSGRPAAAPSVRPYRAGSVTDLYRGDDPFPAAQALLGDELSTEATYAAPIAEPRTNGRPIPPTPEPIPFLAVPTAPAHPAFEPAPTRTVDSAPPAVRPFPGDRTWDATPSTAQPEDRTWEAAPSTAQPEDRTWEAAPSTAQPEDHSLAGRLIELGVPANLARRAVGRDPYSGIVRALSMLPAPAAPPTAPGEILLVAGEMSAAITVAKQAARRMRVDPASVLVVGPTVAGTGLHSSRRVSGPAEAQKRAAKLHAADVPHIVVIDAPLDRDDGRWVRSVAEALGATAVWAVVDATRKTADVARQLRGMGLVDAIAVQGVTATGDPASVLGLGAPIASIDGRRATPQAWAALLCDLLDPDDTDSPRSFQTDEGAP